MAATFPVVPAFADQDVSPSAPFRVVAQMVLVVRPVRHPTRLVLPIAMDRVDRLAQKAWDASVDPDAGHPVFDLPAQCPEAVRDFHRSASVDAREPKAAHSPFQ